MTKSELSRIDRLRPYDGFFKDIVDNRNNIKQRISEVERELSDIQGYALDSFYLSRELSRLKACLSFTNQEL